MSSPEPDPLRIFAVRARKMRSRICVVVAVLATMVANCATTYQRMGFTGGYSDEYLGNDIYLVTVAVNAYTDVTTAYSYFHRRASEIVEEYGYDGYEVLELSSSAKSGITYIGDRPYFFQKPRVFGRLQCYQTLTEEPRIPIKSSGTGFLVTPDVIATNYHIVAEASEITVSTADRTYPAHLIARDPVNDIALLQVVVPGDVDPLLPLPVGRVSSVEAGDPVYTAGYPLSDILGSDLRISEGIVNSTTGLADDPRMFQISIPVQPGNSGSPLFDRKGNVVGIVTMTLDNRYLVIQSGVVPQNVNFAVKVSYMVSLIDQFPKISKDLLQIQSSKNMTAAEIARNYKKSIALVTAQLQ